MKARLVLTVDVDDRQGGEILARLSAGVVRVQLHTRGLLPVLLAEGELLAVAWDEGSRRVDSGPVVRLRQDDLF